METGAVIDNERRQNEDYEQSQGIYMVTDGLTSPSSKETYRLAFNHFIKTTIKNDDLRTLINTKSSKCVFDLLNARKNIKCAADLYQLDTDKIHTKVPH